MIRIIPPSPFIKLMHNKPSFGSGEERYITYCIKKDVEEGTLLYNVLTKEMIIVEHNEKDSSLVLEYLRRNLFVVDSQNDDVALAQKVRHFAKSMARTPDYYRKYTIFTTTKCNARCYYCFEKGYRGMDMPDSIAEKVANVIAENHNKAIARNQDEIIQIDWFGGEPLVCQKPMNIITSILHKNGVKFRSRITTNGLLLDKETIDRSCPVWNITEVHVTIDGTEQVYNRTKRYVIDDGSISPYKVVLNNINELLAAGIKVVVRLHVGLHNEDDILQLCKELDYLAGGRKGLKIYCNRLLDKCESYDKPLSLSAVRRIDSSMALINLFIRDTGRIRENREILYRINTHKCMADDDSTMTIYPNGELLKCEHYCKDEVIGHIDEVDNLDKSRIEIYKEEKPIDDICKKCIWLPNCFRLKGCFHDINCDEGKKERYEWKLDKMVADEYASWKNRVQK